MSMISTIVLGTATAARGVTVVVLCDLLIRAARVVGRLLLMLIEGRLRA
jgi:hypothetical protein